MHVRLLDTSERPVQGALFRYAWGQEIHQQLSKAGRVVQPEMLTLHAVTDADGMFSVTVDDTSGLFTTLILRLEHDRLALRGTPEEEAPGIFGLPINGWLLRPDIGRRESTHTLYCDVATQVILEVRYADGQPFTGTLTYSTVVTDDDDNPTRRFHHTAVFSTVELEDVTEYEVGGLHPEATLSGGFTSTRIGFVPRTNFRHVVAEGDRVEVVIPRAERPQWGVIVDLSILEEDEEVAIQFISPDGGRLPNETQRGPGEVRSRNLAPRDGFRVFVAGNNQAWFSEPLTLSDQPFEWQRIVVPRQAPVALEMTIIDQDGKPVHPAIVMIDTRMRGNWRFPDSNIPNPRLSDLAMRQFLLGRGLADVEGQVRFEWLAAGTHELLVEAPGFFRRTISYTGTPGDTVYLGDIIIERIPKGGGGRVEVKLVGAPDPTLYVLGMTGRANVPFPPSGELIITEIDFHRYHLVVLPAAGGDTVDQKHIILEPSNPTVHWEAQYKSD
jgi:hypothetical protein